MRLRGHSFEKPFKVQVFDGLLEDEAQVQLLRRELAKCVKLKRKDNDLYRFAQSKDLRCELDPKKLSPRVNQFVEMLATKLRAGLQKQSSIKLSEKHMDVTVSRYKKGNYLLCHNDHIKYGGAASQVDSDGGHRRALAYVYYLTKRPWNLEEDGGALALYEADSMGEPARVVRRIEPNPNRLVVFETSELSWHAVEEVFCSNDIRLSINGWFHTDNSIQQSYKLHTLESCPSPLYKPIPVTSRVERFFQECVNQEYLSNRTCTLIRRRFKKKSEINLVNFLVPEKYKQISDSLRYLTKEQQNLILLTPYNKRNYNILKLDTLKNLCRDLYEAFRSELFYMLLARLTGLELQPPSLGDPGSPEEGSSDSGESDSDSIDSFADIKSTADVQESFDVDVTGNDSPVVQEEDVEQEEETQSERVEKPTKRKKISDPLARFEFRHFQHGSYTLIHDHSFELAEKSALDVMLHFNHDFEVNFQDGGFISYIDGSGEANSTDDELLTVEPKSNCLSLVYRADRGTCRFVKHINKTHQADYQDLSCVFYEKPDDLPSDAIIQAD